MLFKKLKNLFKKKIVFFLIMDIALISLAMFLAFLFRFDANIPDPQRNNLWIFIGLALVINLPIFIWRGLYGLSWSYVSVQELISIIKAITIGSAFLGTALFILRDYSYFQGFTRSIIFINYFLTLLFITGLRASKRIVYEANHKERMIDNIRAQDLIKRDEVPADKNLIKNFLENKINNINLEANSQGEYILKKVNNEEFLFLDPQIIFDKMTLKLANYTKLFIADNEIPVAVSANNILIKKPAKLRKNGDIWLLIESGEISF